VVVVDGDGQGLRVYDTGVAPRRICDTGEFLYILNDTGLYVLRDDTLHQQITFDSAQLLLAQSGLGLLESKRLRWFSKEGGYLGSVLSRDPIRRAYYSSGAMVVETRQRRAAITGAPSWWD
jgi:hypothetical protein